MLKKLQNLLFEDEETDEEEEQEEEVQAEPVHTEKKAVKTEKKKEAPAFEQEPRRKDTGMQRIDVTQSVEVPKTAKADNAHFDSVFKQEPAKTQTASAAPAASETRKTLGLNVDEVVGPAAAAQETPAAAKKTARSTTAGTNSKKNASGYTFTSIISPYFGINPKDMNAVDKKAKTHTSSKNEDTGTKIISPFFGTAGMSSSIKTVDKNKSEETRKAAAEEPRIPEFNATAVKAASAAAAKSAAKSAPAEERGVPEFSLDDILTARDQESVSEEKEETARIPTLFDDFEEQPSDEIDTTTVIDKTKYQSRSKEDM